jgi:hypothetical protein
MAGKHDVWIFKHGIYKARPAVAFGEANKPFKFRNVTDRKLTLKFPDGLMTQKEMDVEPGQSATLDVDQNASGAYEYTVEVHVTGPNVHAVGESAPMIIIDP